jgi:hypothetical protein
MTVRENTPWFCEKTTRARAVHLLAVFGSLLGSPFSNPSVLAPVYLELMKLIGVDYTRGLNESLVGMNLLAPDVVAFFRDRGVVVDELTCWPKLWEFTQGFVDGTLDTQRELIAERARRWDAEADNELLRGQLASVRDELTRVRSAGPRQWKTLA